MYLTYEEYIEYGGTLDETTFLQYCFECSKKIDAFTAERIKAMTTIPETVKRCMMALLYQEQLYTTNMQNIIMGNSAGNEGRLVSSYINDGYQESFATGGGDPGTYMAAVRHGIDLTESNTIKSYLALERDDTGTLLLYRGVF